MSKKSSAGVQGSGGSQVPDRILALDLGSRYIGIALYQSGFGIKELSILQFKDLFDLSRQIKKIVEQYQIQLVVVGDMGLGDAPLGLEKLVDQVSREEKIEFAVISEKFTSFQAENETKRLGRDKTQTHSRAAKLILVDYLESQRL